jgi:phage tail-like protein
MPETDIYRSYNFVLDIPEITQTYFTEVSGLSVTVESIPYREGGAAPAVRKLPGRVEYGDITLKWGMSESTELWEWLMVTVQGNVERKEMSIILLAPDGQQENTRWNLHNAWPNAWRGAQLRGDAQGVAIETLVIAHEGIERA